MVLLWLQLVLVGMAVMVAMIVTETLLQSFGSYIWILHVCVPKGPQDKNACS